MKREHRRYGSIQGIENGKFLESMIKQGLHTGEWVATEKVHGCNFSFVTDGISIWNAMRSVVMGADQSFKGSKHVEKYRVKVLEIYEELEQNGMIELGDTLVVFGELFGGNFFGNKIEGCSKVQPGMSYHPGNEFVVTDIQIFPELEEDNYILTYKERLDVVKDRIPLVPEIARGNLLDLVQMDPLYNSHVPALFGLEIPEGEFAMSEGFVFVPVDGNVNKGDHRCILKLRNKNFKGQNKDKKKRAPAGSNLSEADTLVFSEFTTYITEDRLETVLSKVPDVKWSEFNRVVGLLLVDAKEDFEKDNEVNLKATDVWKNISKSLTAVCMELVRAYFMANLE